MFGGHEEKRNEFDIASRSDPSADAKACDRHRNEATTTSELKRGEGIGSTETEATDEQKRNAIANKRDTSADAKACDWHRNEATTTSELNRGEGVGSTDTDAVDESRDRPARSFNENNDDVPPQPGGLFRDRNLRPETVPGAMRIDGNNLGSNLHYELAESETNRVPAPALETAISAYILDEEEERQRIQRREKELARNYEDQLRREMVSEMQHAERVDPNDLRQQRERMAARRRMRKFASVTAVFVVIVVGIGMALIVVFVVQDEGQSKSNREKKLVQLLWPISGSALRDETSPRYHAFRWLVDQDPMQLNLGDERIKPFEIIERYVVALFYFSTGGPSNWTSTFSFLSNTSICEWRHPEDEVGVTCHVSGRVWYLEFVKNNLYGTLPEELSSLEELEEIFIYKNKLYGTIPSSLKKNRRFEHLMIAENEMTGTIPDLSNLRNFQRLTTRANYLTGTIPSWLTMSGQLDFLNIGDNIFSGTLPPFASQDGLEVVAVARNLFTGTIPSSLTSLSVIEYLDLADNAFTGPIPSSIGRLTAMQEIFADNNGITGVLPSELGLLQDVFVLYLDNNQLTGTLPTELGNLLELNELRLDRNLFSGTVPTQLARLERLNGLRLHNNSFTGNATSYCASANEIGIKTPDFFSTDCGENEDQELLCSCCSHCCSDATGTCFETASLEKRCADKLVELEGSAIDERGTVCECLGGGLEVACRDTNCMYCNDDGNICYVDSERGVRLGVEDVAFFGVAVQYVKGRNENISFVYDRERTTGDLCTGTINDDECKSCNLVACAGDGFVSYVLDCSNLGYGRLSACYDGDDPFDPVWSMINGLYYNKALPTRFDCVRRDAVDGYL